MDDGKLPTRLLVGRTRLAIAIVITSAAIAIGVGTTYSSTHPGSQILIFVLYVVTVIAVIPVIVFLLNGFRDRADEYQARERVRQAEVNLADALSPDTRRLARSLGSLIPDARSFPENTGQTDERLADDRLALAALWTVTHERLDLYHRIATGQARRSFVTAQGAMLTGFMLLIVFAFLAVHSHTPVGAIITGSLGGVAAAFAGYIGRTFVRSQESAASHLRAYFDQPLDFSKYLAAERLLAASEDLTSDQQAKILNDLVQAIVAPSNDRYVQRERHR